MKVSSAQQVRFWQHFIDELLRQNNSVALKKFENPIEPLGSTVVPRDSQQYADRDTVQRPPRAKGVKSDSLRGEQHSRLRLGISQMHEPAGP